MAVTLLQSWLAHYDPLHRGWTPAGIANGVCATNGFYFPRIAGGYNLRRAVGQGPGSAAPIVGVAGAGAGVIQTFPWITHAAGATYTYRLTPIGGGGVENMTDETLTTAAFDEDGDWVGLRPNAPTDLQVTPTAGGQFILRWTYLRAGEQAEPQEFRIYHDDGGGAVNFATVVAAVAYGRGRLHYSYTSESFPHGLRLLWAVRTASAAGVEEGNVNTVIGWADNQAPPPNPAVVISCV